MKSFREFLAKQLEDPEFRQEYEASRSDFEAIKAQLRAELADKQPARNTYPIKKYDADHDVLHVYLSWRCNDFDASSEEPVRNIWVIYDDETDEIVGFKILDYRKNGALARQMYPQYDLSA